MELKKLIGRLEDYDGIYRKAEIEEAISRKDEITPHLIEILKILLKNPLYYVNSDYFGHFHALFLLSFFEETKAHRLIVDLMSLPDDLPYSLFDDPILEYGASALIKTSGGDLTLIKELALNKDADEYSRSSAISAINYGVIVGYISRNDALQFFKEFLENRKSETKCLPYHTAIDEMLNLCPDGFFDLIDTCCREGYYEERYSTDYFMEAVEKGVDTCLEDLKRTVEYFSINDLHEVMSWWACFQDAEKSLQKRSFKFKKLLKDKGFEDCENHKKKTSKKHQKIEIEKR